LKGEAIKPFRFKALGQLCSIGGYSAVAEMFGMRVSGFLAWFLWRGVYLFKLPTWSRRAKVALDWAWDLLFPRDLSFLNTDSAQQVYHAYYRPGDFIQRQGESARFFSVIEEGEVEILKAAEPNAEPKIVAVLGKGDFFGEAALLGNRPHETSIRARTVVRLRQAGSALFSQIAGTFAPLREVLSQAVIRRSGDVWHRLPLTKSILEGEPLASLLDPLPAELLRKDTSLADAIRALKESSSGQLIILDEAQRLWGTLDRNDLDQIVARIAVLPEDQHGNITRSKLSEFLVVNPVYVALDDSTLVAVATLLDHGISWLTVVQSKDNPRPVGYLRREKILDRMIERIGHTQAEHARVAS
jgi:NADH dehydrogenase